MLVISRKRDESFTVDSVITVTIVEIRGDKVRVGIDAPKNIPIVRDDAGEQEPRFVHIETPEESCHRLETTPLEEMTRSDLCRRIGMLEAENEILMKGLW